MNYFPAYRKLVASRVAANDAMMALLIAGRVAKHHLDDLSEADGDRLLPAVFADLPDIGRMNRTVDDTREMLPRAERHLVYMAIPFVLSVYQTFALDVIALLQRDGKAPTADVPARLDLSEIHDYLIGTCRLELPPTEVALFEFIRQVRNRIIHFAGLPGSRLRAAYWQHLSLEARTLYAKLAGKHFEVQDRNSPVNLSDRDLYPALAVTKRLSKAVNRELGRKLSRALWADVVAEDYRAEEPERSGEKAQGLRRLRGYAAHRYPRLQPNDSELKDAIERLERSRRGGSSH